MRSPASRLVLPVLVVGGGCAVVPGPTPYDASTQRFSGPHAVGPISTEVRAIEPPGLLVVQADGAYEFDDPLASHVARSIEQTGLLAARTTGAVEAWGREQSPPLSLLSAAGRAQIDARFGGVLFLRVRTYPGNSIFAYSPASTRFELSRLDGGEVLSVSSSDEHLDLAPHLDDLLTKLCGPERARCPPVRAEARAPDAPASTLPEVRAGLGNLRSEPTWGLGATLTLAVANSHGVSDRLFTIDVDGYFGAYWGVFGGLVMNGGAEQPNLFAGVAGGLAQYRLLEWFGLEYRLGLGGGSVRSSGNRPLGTFLVYQRFDVVFDLFRGEALSVPLFATVTHTWSETDQLLAQPVGGHDLYLGFGGRFEL